MRNSSLKINRQVCIFKGPESRVLPTRSLQILENLTIANTRDSELHSIPRTLRQSEPGRVSIETWDAIFLIICEDNLNSCFDRLCCYLYEPALKILPSPLDFQGFLLASILCWHLPIKFDFCEVLGHQCQVIRGVWIRKMSSRTIDGRRVFQHCIKTKYYYIFMYGKLISVDL